MTPHPRPPTPCDYGHSNQNATPIPIPDIIVAFPDSLEGPNYYGNYNDFYCGSEFTSTSTTLSSLTRLGSFRRLTRSSSSLGPKSGQRGRAYSTGATTGLGDFAEAARDAMAEKRRPWGRTGSFRTSGVDSRRAPPPPDDDELDGYVPYRPPYVSQPTPSTSQPIVIKPSGAQGIGLAPKRTPPKHGRPPISKKPSFFRKLLGTTRNDRSKLISASTPSLSLQEKGDRPHYHQHQHQHYHYQRHGRQPSQSSTQFYQANTFNGRHYQTRRHDARNIPSVGTGLSGPSVLFSPLTRNSSVRHSVRNGSTGGSNVSNLNVALLGDSSNMNIQPSTNHHLYASTPNLIDMSEKQSQPAHDWRHTREHRRPGASISHSQAPTTPPTRRRSLRRGDSTLSLHSEGSRSRLAVSTMCDALTFPRPRMYAHEVTPPDSPTDDEALSTQATANINEFKQAMHATVSRNTEREDWAAITRRPSGSSMHRKSSSWSRGSDCSHSQPSIINGPPSAFTTPRKHNRTPSRERSRDRSERDYGERIYPQRTNSVAGSLRSFFIGSSSNAHSEDDLLGGGGRRSRPSSRMSYSDTEQSSNLHSGPVRPGSASSGHSLTIIGSSRGLPKSTSTPSLVPHKTPKSTGHTPRRSKSHRHSRRHSRNDSGPQYVPPPPVIRHAGPPRAFQFHLQSAARAHTGVVTIGGTSQERTTRHFRPPPPPPVSARPVDFAQARLRRPQSTEPPVQRRNRPRRLSSPVNLDRPPVQMVSIKAAPDEEIGVAITTDRDQPLRSPVRRRLDADDDSASAHARYLAARQQRQNASLPSLLSDGPVTPTADRQVLPPAKSQTGSGPFQFQSSTSSVVPVSPKEPRRSLERKDRFLSTSDVPPVPSLQASWYAAHARSPSTPPLSTQSVVNIPAETEVGPSSPMKVAGKGSERGSILSEKPIHTLSTPTASSSYPESPTESSVLQSLDSPTISPFADVHRAPASAPARIPPRRAPPTHPPPPAPIFAPSHSRNNSQSRSGSSWKFNAPSVSSGSQHSQNVVTPARSKAMTANMTPLGFLAASSPPKSTRELTPEDQEPAMEESPEGTQPRSDTPPPKQRETLMDESPTPIRTFRVQALAPPRPSPSAAASFAAQQAATPVSSSLPAAQPSSPMVPLSPTTPLGNRLNMGSTTSLVPGPAMPDSLPDSSPLIGQVSPVSVSQPLASPAPETPTFGAERSRSNDSISTTTSVAMPSLSGRTPESAERPPAAAAAILKRRGQGSLSIQTSPSTDRIRQDHRHLSVTRSLTPDSIARSIAASEMSETTLPDLFPPPEESEASHYSSAMEDSGSVDTHDPAPEEFFTPTIEEQQPMFPDFRLSSIELALEPFPEPPTPAERDRPLPPLPALGTRSVLGISNATPGPSRPSTARAQSSGAVTTLSQKSSNQSIRFAASVKQQEEKRSVSGPREVLENLLHTPRALSRRSSGHSTAHSTAFEYDKRSSLASLSSGSEGSMRPSLDGDFNGLFFRAPPVPAPLGHPFNRNSQHSQKRLSASSSASGSVIAPLASVKRTPVIEQLNEPRSAITDSPFVGGSEGTPELRTPLTGDPHFGRTLPTPPHPPSPRASPPRVTLDMSVLESPPRTTSYEPRGEIDISASPVPAPARQLDEHSWITECKHSLDSYACIANVSAYRLSQQSAVVRSRSATSSRRSSCRKPRSGSASGDVSFSPTTFGVHSLPSSAPGSGTSTPILLDEIRVQRQYSSPPSRRRS